MVQKTKDDQEITGYFQPVYIINEYAATLQGLTRDSVQLSDDDYSKLATYTITFTPYSSPNTHAMILLNYPSTIELGPDTVSGGCKVTAGSYTSPSGSANCKKIATARLVQILDAIPPGWTKPVTLTIQFRNPNDNWGNIGFKIKTYELDKTSTPPD